MTAASARTRLWLPGLLVAGGAAVATAHGLYEVARAAGAPTIAALYPVMCDGLALVAYGATARLYETGRSYAWTIVVLAAGLSGLAQAAHLAGGGVRDVPVWLRAGVGAWPALAAAIVAHLLHLLATSEDGPLDAEVSNPSNALSNPSNALSNPSNGVYSRTNGRLDGVVRLNGTASNPPSNDTEPLDGNDLAGPAAPARDRARTVAEAHLDRHGGLPLVNQLAVLADVARGTAAAALRQLRGQPPGWQITVAEHNGKPRP